MVDAAFQKIMPAWQKVLVTLPLQSASYFCLMKSPRPSLAEKAAGKGVFGLSGRIL